MANETKPRLSLGGVIDQWKKISGNVGFVVGQFERVQSYADALTRSRAQLSILVDDGGSVKELEEQILASAQRSRTGYLEAMQGVVNLGAGAADTFSGVEEQVRFVEVMNQGFAVAGTEESGRSSAMKTVGQAMGGAGIAAGDLPGLEQNAPLLVESIESYMAQAPEVTGSIEDWAAEGLLTGEVIKNALFASTGEIEGRLQETPTTFAQAWSGVGNKMQASLAPALGMIQNTLDTGQLQTAASGLASAFSVVALVLATIFSIATTVGAAIADNWGWIGPIVLGAAAALGVYLVATRGVALAHTIGEVVMTTFKLLQEKLAIGFGVLTGNTAASSAAVFTFNSALMASPLTWALILIIAIVAAVFAVVGAINHFMGTSISAMGVICGAVMTVVAVIYNTVVGVINAIIQTAWTVLAQPFLGIFEWIMNVANGGFNSFGDGIANLIGQIIGWFLNLGKIVTNIIDAIFGTHWTEGLDSLQASVTAWGKNEDSFTAPEQGPPQLERFAYQDAYSSGYGFGSGLEDKVKGAFHFGETGETDPWGGAFDPDAYGLPEMDGSLLEGIYDNTGAIAGNTAETRDAVELSGEELSLMRELAEQRAINRYTTAEITVNQHNENHMDGSADLDGIMEAWSADFAEKLDISAEGVHL